MPKNRKRNDDDEKALRELLIRLFQAMGFKDVFHHHGGSLEQGKDITMWKLGELGERVNYAVVVKCGDVTGKAAGKGGAGEVQTQVQQSLGSTFHDKTTMEQQQVDFCWVVASGKISKEAHGAIQTALERSNCLARTKLIDGVKLDELVQQFLPGKTLLDQIHELQNTAKRVDPNFDVSVQVSGDTTNFGLLPKRPDVQPPIIRFKGRFTDDEAGRAAQKQFEDFIKRGGPLKLDKGQVVDVELPDVIQKIVGGSEHKAFGFEFTPHPGNLWQFRFEARTDSGEVASLAIVELRMLRAGTEEITLSNEQQKYPAVVRFLVTPHGLTVRFEPRCIGHNVHQVAEWLRFQKALSQAGIVKVTLIATGVDFLHQRIEKLLPAPDSDALEMAEALEFIQSKTLAPLVWPEVITVEEQEEILRVVEILKTGRELIKDVSVTLDRSFDPSEATVRMGEVLLKSDGDEHRQVLGVSVNLGTSEIRCEAAQLSLSPLAANKENAGQTQGIITAQPGSQLMRTYPKWLPSP